MPTLNEIQDYLARSGDDAFRWEYPIHEFEGGWFTWYDDAKVDALIVLQAYGNNRALLKQAKMMARQLHRPRIRFATQHKGAAMARLFGGRVVAEIIDIEV